MSGVFLAGLFYRAGDSVLAVMAAEIALNVILGIGGVNLASTAFWTSTAVLTALIAVATLRHSARSEADLHVTPPSREKPPPDRRLQPTTADWILNRPS